MARRVVKTYVDRHTKELVEADTPFKGTNERFEELKNLGYADDVETHEDLTKDQIIEKLEENNIEHDKKENKEKLFELLQSEE